MFFFRKKISFSTFFQYSLSLLLFLLPWQTIWITKEQFLNGSKWEYGTLGFYATEILLFFCAALFCIQIWREIKQKKIAKTFHFSWTPDRRFILACVVFIAYVFCSAFWSIDPAVAYQHALWVMEAFLLFFMLTAEDLSTAAYSSFIAGAVVQSLLAIWQFLTQSTFSSTILGLSLHPSANAGTSIISTLLDGRWLRAYGAFPHPNMLGGYLVVAIIVTDIIRNSKLEIRDLTPRFSSFYFLVSSLQLTALFFTFSRSAWLAVALWFIGSSVLYRNVPKPYLLSHISYRFSRVILFAILCFIFSPLVFTRLNGSTPAELRSYDERTTGYHEAVTLIKQHPFFGVGIGNYTAALYHQNPNLPGYEYQPVHDVPLLFLAEIGAIGVLLLSIIFLSLITYLRSHSHLSQQYRLSLIAALSLTPLLFFDHYLFSSYTGLLLSAIFLSILLKNPSTISPQLIHTTD